jgi:hypothetical protein
VASAQLPHGHEWANCAPFKCPAPSPRSLPADPTEPSSGRWTAWASGFLLTQPSNGYIQLPKRTMLRVPAGKKKFEHWRRTRCEKARQQATGTQDDLGGREVAEQAGPLGMS